MSTRRPAILRYPLLIDEHQKAALDRKAAERDVNISALLREAVTVITGVPDSISSHRRHRRPLEYIGGPEAI